MSRREGHSRPPGVLADGVFRRYFIASVISIAGTTVTVVVLPILIYQLTHSPLQTSLLASIEVAPYLLFGLVAGPLADRTDRKRLMVICNLLSGAVMATIPAASALGVLYLPVIYGAAVANALCFVFFDAADFGALPALAGREHLVAATSLLSTAGSFLLVVGPAVGAVLATTVGAATAITLDAASFVIAAAVLTTISRPFQSERTCPVGRRRDEAKEGLRFVWRHPVLRTLTIAGFGNSLTFGAVMGLLVVYAVRQLGLTDHDARIGLLYSAGAAGALVAGVTLPVLLRRLPPARLTQLSLAASAALLVGMAATTRVAMALPIYLVWSWTKQLTIINGITYRQLVTPDHLQARVNVVGRMVAWGGQPLGAALGGVLAQTLDVRATFLIMVGGVVVATVVAVIGLRDLSPTDAASPTAVTGKVDQPGG